MPRRQFLRDLERIKIRPPPNIHRIRLEDDENIAFHFISHTQNNHIEVNLKLIPTNVDEYPAKSSYILFTDDNDVNQDILNILETVQTLIRRVEISDALKAISSSLERSKSAGSQCNPLSLDEDGFPVESVFQGLASDLAAGSVMQSDVEDAKRQEEDSDVDLSESEADSDGGFGFANSEDEDLSAPSHLPPKESSIDVSKIKGDLLATKQAGFRIGVHEQLSSSGIVCTSIRIAKLGISNEAMKAWSLDKAQYLILLMRFRHGYRSLSTIQGSKSSTEYIEMYVGLCDLYKPSFSAATEVFNQVKIRDLPNVTQHSQKTASGAVRPLFIGKALNDLLRNRFAQIIHFRSFGLSWAGAEQLYNETQGSTNKITSTSLENYLLVEDGPLKRALPPIVMADILNQKKVPEAPLPLVAMQFVLRHFVRCAEFCLVCHCKTDTTFEALKPYVCSKPLCLYQFFSYGFGPSVEYEIISQPYVVDLLVSLCFSQATTGGLQEKPYGLRLKVPVLPNYSEHNLAQDPTIHTHTSRKEKKGNTTKEIFPSFSAKWSPQKDRITLSGDAWTSAISLRGGEWLTVVRQGDNYRHFRVRNVLQPHIYLFDCIIPAASDRQTVDVQPTSEIWVECYLYDKEFDSIPPQFQPKAIMAMLNCLPGVLKLRERLLNNRHDHGDISLQTLKELPPAARDLLRWIIASNRSCIMQADPFRDSTDTREPQHESGLRVSGMRDWIQFRFAQGAPDKEQRFVEAVTLNATNKKSPTLFAWHGSPIHNWHSIIRQGLNFDVVAHGRANGDGVYMSSQLHTSLGFSSPRVSSTSYYTTWSNSVIKASQVVSLQEFVNAPSLFVCHHPHFVVAQKEWIQTRYLFVKIAERQLVEDTPKEVYGQDPRFPVYGDENSAIKIPMTAVSRLTQGSRSNADSTKAKRRKTRPGRFYAAESDDDVVSVATLIEDLHWLDHEDNFLNPDNKMKDVGDQSQNIAGCTSIVSPPSGCKRRRGNGNYILDSARTDFVPGNLDLSDIRFLSAPSDATRAASRALMRSLNEVLQTQKTTPLHELGFYIDQDYIEDIYQWIVELHSFDKSLPLGQDLHAAGLTSVVLEMRFSNQFPFAPPFIRVVRPQFLPFLAGGGGHVTEGGAICMELLTSSGWSAVLSIESILLQIKLAICDEERPARLLRVRGGTGSGHSNYDTRSYPIGEAVIAFRRACSKHGWKIPDDLETLASRT